MLITGAAVGLTRIARGEYITAEDYAFAGKTPPPAENPTLSRLRRAHQNDLENIPVFFVVGDGDEGERLRDEARACGLESRVRFTGALRGPALWDAFAAMDVFAFASRSETQGMVLLEAMAVGVPVVALDARGAEDVVVDGENGELVADEDESSFSSALERLADRARSDPRLRRAALETARAHSMEAQSRRLLLVYDRTRRRRDVRDSDDSRWRRRVEAEWTIWSSRLRATAKALSFPLS